MQVLQDRVGQGGVQQAFDLAKPPLVRQQDGHGDLAALVQQLHGLIPRAAHVTEAPLLAHHRRFNLAPTQRVERKRRRRALVEGQLPRCLEVDGVGEHQPCQGINRSGRNQARDAALRLTGDPLVNADARLLRGAAKVRSLHVAPVLLRQDVQEGGQERVVLLAPDGVRDTQTEAIAVFLRCPLSP